jgi:hypothetical protein
MATANSYLQVTELDFEDIRDNLKTYLSTQTQFRDYNFEGSALAVLLDVLAYNTHYNAYYVNMLANEMFLDTAQQRDSVVSHAKLVGYTPVSAIGASSNVAITFTGVDAGVSQITIPKNSKFTTTVDDVTYTYVTPEANILRSTTNTFTGNINIKEGEPLTHRFTVTGAGDRFIIPNTNVDTSSIKVTVQNSSVDTDTTEFIRATNIREIYATSEVYFLEESADQKYEVIFGNGTLGKAVVTGNIVIVEYLVCNGGLTNGADTFSVDTIQLQPSGTGYTSVSLTTNTSARGGRFSESVESIKFNAPRIYQTQNRCVVDNDYQRIILNENADLESVVAFGGEEADPPQYGKVYIAVKPFGELYSTLNRKTSIRISITDRTPLGIDPVIIDADYTYVIPTVTTYYDRTKTNISEAAIESDIRDAISAFSTANLGRFGNKLRYSRFVRALDNVTNAAVLNNDASMKLQKRFAPDTNISQKISLKYNNEIRPGTVISTEFTYSGYSCYFDDDSNGNINIFRYNAAKERVNVVNNTGTIDYTTGEITVESFAPTAYSDNTIDVTVSPIKLDIIPVREQILLLNAQDAEINTVAEYT